VRRHIWIWLAFTSWAGAQVPVIYNRSIFNAASFMPQAVPGGAIAQGSIFSVFGQSLGPATATQASSFPLPTTLANVAVTITQGSTKVNAIPLYVSASQINAILPSNAPLGPASLRVLYNNIPSNPMTVVVAANAFGIFTATGTGLGPGVLFNYVSASSQPINSATTTAQPGQIMTLYGTGLGAAPGGIDNMAPSSGNLPVQVEVFVGGISAKVTYSGRSSCCAGLDQIVFTIPSSAPSGCWVPVLVRTAGTTVSNVVTIAIGPAGASCYAVPAGVLPAFFKNHRAGAFVAIRATTREDVGTIAPVDVTADYHASVAYKLQPAQFPFNPLTSFPPAGTCTAYSVQGDLLKGDSLPGALPASGALDMGPLFTLSGPLGMRMLTELFTGSRVGYLGGSISTNDIPNSLFLNPGPYTLMGTGGSDVGPFTAKFTAPQPFSWTNRDQLTLVDRSMPLMVSWTGANANDFVGLIGFGEDLPTNTTTVFACLAPQGATGLSVPVTALANIPETRPNPLQSKDVLYLVSVPQSSVTTIPATGLDAGFAGFSYVAGKTVVFE